SPTPLRAKEPPHRTLHRRPPRSPRSRPGHVPRPTARRSAARTAPGHRAPLEPTAGTATPPRECHTRCPNGAVTGLCDTFRVRPPKILAVASAIDLDFRYGCTPA